MALSAATLRSYSDEQSTVGSLPVKASSVIYLGSAVGLTSGYARALTAGDIFGGFCMEAVTGTASDGGVNVTVKTRGLVKLSVSSIAVTDIGKVVYASDDGTFTLTQSTNSPVGRVHRWIETGSVVVAFDTARPARVTGITALTDNSAGTANNTVQALADGTTYATDVAAIRNNFADLTAKINELIAILK
jgi:hypothetical protein